MEGATRLGSKYSKYCYLIAIDTEEFVYAFTEAAPAPTDAEYYTKVRELHDASTAIEICSLKCELFELVRVDTSEATKVGHVQGVAFTACTRGHLFAKFMRSRSKPKSTIVLCTNWIASCRISLSLNRF